MFENLMSGCFFRKSHCTSQTADRFTMSVPTA